MRRGVIEVAISGSFILSLIIAIVSVYFLVVSKSWVAKLILFVVAVGASNAAAGVFQLDPALVLLINVVLFLVAGATSIRTRGAGARVLGIVLTVLGVALFFLFINVVAPTTPGTVWNAIAESAKGGVSVITDLLHRLLG